MLEIDQSQATHCWQVPREKSLKPPGTLNGAPFNKNKVLGILKGQVSENWRGLWGLGCGVRCWGSDFGKGYDKLGSIAELPQI